MAYKRSFRNLIRHAVHADNPGSRVLAMPYRLNMALSYCLPRLSKVPGWVLRSREMTNFTYELRERNMRYLASTIALVTGQTQATVSQYMEELQHDRELRDLIAEAINRSPLRSVTDRTVSFGRRLGWYAMARCLKPRLIIETGVDKGLGSVVLCAALLRNATEGSPGRYYGTDINPEAGFLLAGKYASTGKILYGDSIQSLTALNETVDLFINDSDHSADYEFEEYRTIAGKLSERAIIIGDNSHCTDCLWRFSQEAGREFLFFAEEPANHWYPGAGLGISFAHTN